MSSDHAIDSITETVVAYRCSIAPPDSRGSRRDTEYFELSDISSPDRRNFILDGMKAPRKSLPTFPIREDEPQVASQDDDMFVLTLMARYPLVTNIVQWLIVAAIGVAFFMGYYEERFVVSLYWTVITGLAVGYVCLLCMCGVPATVTVTVSTSLSLSGILS